jgi:hypothetical protein
MQTSLLKLAAKRSGSVLSDRRLPVPINLHTTFPYGRKCAVNLVTETSFSVQ